MRKVILGLGASVISVTLASGVALAGIPASGDSRAYDLLTPVATEVRDSDLLTPLAADAQDSEQPDAPQHMVDRMHELTGLPRDQIIALRTQRHLGWGEIRHAATLNVAIGNQLTVEQIVDRKTEDHGWGAIARDLGLHPSILGKGGKGASSAAKGGPPAHAKAGKPEAAK